MSEQKTVTVVHELPSGGRVTVTVTADDPTEENFPCLRKSTAIASAEALLNFAALFSKEAPSPE